MNEKNKKIINTLIDMYPDAKCELEHKSPFQLLIATVLSAQTTDKKVNEVTLTLFKDYPDLDSFLKLTEEQIQQKIKVIGLYKNKSKNIVKLCKKLKEEFNGVVPETHEELMSLDGVGRKTANVVLSNAFGKDAIAVDVHVFRVSNRIGLASAKTPELTEVDLMKNIDKKLWSLSHHLLIFHGRRCCTARKPKCQECNINLYCNQYKKDNF